MFFFGNIFYLKCETTSFYKIVNLEFTPNLNFLYGHKT